MSASLDHVTDSVQLDPPTYAPLDHHWLYHKSKLENGKHPQWQAFSKHDSLNLEHAFGLNRIDIPVPTNETRFDVSLRERTRMPVYWDGESSTVQRCLWFHSKKQPSADTRFLPYDEKISKILEETYRDCFVDQVWNRRLNLEAPNEFVIFIDPNSVVHYTSESAEKPRYYAVRGVEQTNFKMEPDERSPPDHLVFMVHGIGSFCDMSFRSLIAVCDDFRYITSDLVGLHYGQDSVGTDGSNQKRRVEILPISWHSVLHTAELDAHLNRITLPSIQKVRAFTNDTIFDAMFYTSPKYQTIILQAVAAELNQRYALFLERNSFFGGSIALGGHSLGSLILFDLLSHQGCSQSDLNEAIYSREQLHFRPSSFFAMGSPIAAFLAVRGVQHLGLDFQLPTCPSFYNIFHPYDPIAYRIEPVINQETTELKPVLIPHHKGRKRFHLEIRESIARIGSDLKERVLTSITGTIDSFFGLMNNNNRVGEIEPEIVQQNSIENAEPSKPTQTEKDKIAETNFGRLNSGRRIDYVLQERTIETANEYIFALAAHMCYWMSEDTALLMLRELYGERRDRGLSCEQEVLDNSD